MKKLKGTITKLQTPTNFGELHSGKNIYFYISDRKWKKDEEITFNIAKNKLLNTNISFAINLRSTDENKEKAFNAKWDDYIAKKKKYKGFTIGLYDALLKSLTHKTGIIHDPPFEFPNVAGFVVKSMEEKGTYTTYLIPEAVIHPDTDLSDGANAFFIKSLIPYFIGSHGFVKVILAISNSHN